MAKRTPGIIETKDGRWRIDKTYQGTRLQGRFASYQAAEDWLLSEIERLRQAQYLRPRYKFESIAAKYLLENEDKLSIKTEQRKLLPLLAAHLQRMVLFDLNTGARDDVVCNLRWEWEVYLEELECSVFIVPPRYVKGRKGWRPLVCNRVAQSILEERRGKHPEFVFTYQPGKNIEPHAVETMNNNGWQTVRTAVGLQGVRVHDLRHTVGMRLREAGVREETISDILWHSRGTMTSHYSVAQVRELLDALNLITDESNRKNASLEMLFREKAESLQSSSNRKMG
jgi:integrase